VVAIAAPVSRKCLLRGPERALEAWFCAEVELKSEITAEMNSLPLLVSTAIRVSADTTTKMLDPEARLNATLWGIEQWLKEAAVESIVIVDGSGFDYSSRVDELSRGSGKQSEFLCFQNNAELTRSKGKGFGEGEIVQYALTHSRILTRTPYFAKCTGKLYVRNYRKCLAAYRGSEFMSGVYGRNRIHCLDTRLYFASRDFWLKHLAQAHFRVNDPQGYFLEHSYLDRLREIGLRSFTLPLVPIVVGRSGSDDVEYEVPNLYKRTVRRVRLYIFNKLS